jgi:hypothetical protein
MRNLLSEMRPIHTTVKEENNKSMAAQIQAKGINITGQNSSNGSPRGVEDKAACLTILL